MRMILRKTPLKVYSNLKQRSVASFYRQILILPLYLFNLGKNEKYPSSVHSEWHLLQLNKLGHLGTHET